MIFFISLAESFYLVEHQLDSFFALKLDKTICPEICGLFKLVSQEFYSDNFNSTFAIFGRYIRPIRRHIFYCHKNCTQNVLMHQANNLFWYTKVISRYCIRSWILLSTSQTLPRTFYYTFCTNISFETAALYVLKVYILLSQANDVFFEFFYLFLP